MGGDSPTVTHNYASNEYCDDRLREDDVRAHRISLCLRNMRVEFVTGALDHLSRSTETPDPNTPKYIDPIITELRSIIWTDKASQYIEVFQELKSDCNRSALVLQLHNLYLDCLRYFSSSTSTDITVDEAKKTLSAYPDLQQSKLIESCIEPKMVVFVSSNEDPHAKLNYNYTIEEVPLELRSEVLSQSCEGVQLFPCCIVLQRRGEAIIVRELANKRPNFALKLRGPLKLESSTILKLGDAFIQVNISHPTLVVEVIERRLGSTFRFDPTVEVSVGRSPTSNIRVQSSKISSRHGVFKTEEGHWTYTDLKSRNGSWLMLHSTESIRRDTDSAERQLTKADVLSVTESGNETQAKTIYLQVAASLFS
jgi:hypothetical protein